MVRNLRNENADVNTTWRDRGLHRFQWGICRRNKIKTGTFSCNSIGGAMDIQQVEIYNSKVRTDNFDLDEISTGAVLEILAMKSNDERDKVIDIIKKSVIDDINPVDGKPLGVKGITKKMVKHIIHVVKYRR